MPNGFRAVMSIEYLIKLGYGQGQASPHGDRMSVINLPNWSEQRYQIDARVSDDDLMIWQNQSRNQELLRSAIRQMLKERFHLVLHERLNMYSGRPIYDETKLIGRYDFILRSEEQSENLEDMFPPYDLESLGLELKPGKVPGQDLIIDHVEKPTPN